MSLVRWFRKNNRRLMAVFVVGIMLAFVMPTVLQQLSRPGATKATVAHFGADGKITNKDIVNARWQLNLLQRIWAKQFLMGQQDLRLVLLSELLFHDAGTAAAMSQQINSIVRAKQWRISSRQINNFFAQTKGTSELSPIYWLLLKAEAKEAGILISNSFAGKALAPAIYQMTGGRLSANQLVRQIVEQGGISEDIILETFGDLLAIVVYAQNITSTECLTSQQLMHMVSWDKEKIDVEFVKFDSSFFTQSQPLPTQAELIEHFEKYRGFFPGQITSQNPYGFGYKYPEMVQLEYIALKLDDVASLVEIPLPEETEEYFEKHRSEFTVSIPVDPNDPNSEMIEREKTYAEVADSISKKLLQDRIEAKATMILSKAKAFTEAGFEDAQIEEISNEQYGQLAGDYKQAAEQIGIENNIKLYTGQTGLLTADDLAWDRYLGMLYTDGQNQSQIPLAKIVFALKQLDASDLGPYEVARPRIYENIGPMKDNLERIMVLLRVIRAEEPVEPTDINDTCDKTRLELIDESKDEEITKSQLINDIVIEDLKKLKAMTTARSEAEEFLKLVQADDWDKAIEEFNKRYAAKNEAKDDLSAPVIKLQQFTDLSRLSSQDITTMNLNTDNLPGARDLLYRRMKHRDLIDRFFALLPKDKTSPETLPLIMQFEPEASLYVIKDISRSLISRAEYEQDKIPSAYIEETGQSQALALFHYTPENIVKRMKFRWAGTKQPTTKPENTEPNGVL
jgi:hypothetical protein